MSAVLLENFALLAASEGGVAKLRELILSLAVRGQLVPQDPADEPASELLERIRAEKERLVAKGKIKREKALPPICEEEKPFEIPESWTWVRLPEVTHDWGQKTPTAPFTYIDVGSIDNQFGKLTSETQLLDAENAPSRARKIVKHGTVIYSTVRPYLLNVAVIDKELSPEPIASTAFAILHPYSGVLAKYVFFYLRSSVFSAYVKSKMIGVAYPAINDANFFNGLIPVPPSAEQSRIVAKVEALMALCDRLEAQQGEAARVQAHWTQAALDQLAESADAAEFARHWQALADHFDTLFATPASIDALDATLLQLAVRGKLVPQNPADEPANELLKKIRAEKDRLIAEGQIKRDKPLPPIADHEKPFELPEGWEWVRLGDITELVTSGSRDWAKYYSDQGAIFVRMGNLSRNGYRLRLDKIQYVSPPSSGEGNRTRLEEGDVLLSITGDVGLLGLIPPNFGEAYINQHTCLIRLPGIVRNRYFPELFRSSLAKDQFNAPQRGVKNSFRLTDVTEFVLPLPPLPEQSRIVAKLDELLALTRTLRARLADARTLQARLASALVDEVAA